MVFYFVDFLPIFDEFACKYVFNLKEGRRAVPLKDLFFLDKKRVTSTRQLPRWPPTLTKPYVYQLEVKKILLFLYF